MSRLRFARSAVVAVLSGLLVVGGFGGAEATASAAPRAAAQAEPASLTTLKAQVLAYQQAAGKTAERDIAIGSMGAASQFEAALWGEFVEAWTAINAGMPMNTTVPDGLPATGHVFVVLGSALSSTGKITAKLERRLALALKALAKYPDSMVLVSGGAPKNGNTEAKVMRDWLTKKGIPASRILCEDTSSSTIGNAKNSTALLAKYPTLTSYTLVSDASQLRLASVLFRAGSLLVQERTGQPWESHPVSNVAYLDMETAGQGPLRAASVTNAAVYVASLLGLSTQYKSAVESLSKVPVLTSLVVVPPAKNFSVGTKLTPAAVTATAIYDKGVYSREVTGFALTGFTSATVGNRTAKVSYTERGVTKTASFPYRVVKAASKVAAKPSATKVKRSKTKVTLTAKITAPGSGLVPTGTVEFYLDGKRLKKSALKAANAGKVKFTYPKISKVGKHALVVKYAGTKQLAAANKTVKLTVSR